MFKMARGFALAVFFVAFLPTVASDGGDDFANNLFSDLAPLLALFGERVAQQFMGQSMGWVDNIIFAMAPLGIITAIVGAIRVGGPGWLKAVIGRAREAYAVSELELLSSTSSDVCELWNGVTLVKVLGSPTIAEIIYFNSKAMAKNPAIEEDCGINVTTACTRRGGSRKSSRVSGFLQLFKDHMTIDRDSLVFRRRHHQHDPEKLQPETNQDEHRIKHKTHSPKPSAPNVSLNITESASQTMLWTVAIAGITLQLGVLLFDGLTTYYSSLKSQRQFQKNGNPITTYAFPATAIGTLLVALGMFICAYVVESATEEDELEYKNNDIENMRLVWLQRHGKVGDQLFDSYAIFARGLRTTIRTSRRLEYQFSRESRQPGLSSCSETRPSLRCLKESGRPGETNVLSTLTTAGTLTSVIGFTAQFIGLRSMPWTATIAQLAATGIMTCLRASVRTAGLTEEPDTFKLPQGYELDWLAMRLGDFQDDQDGLYSNLSEKKMAPEFWTQGSWKWRVVTGRHIWKRPIPSPEFQNEPPQYKKAAKVVAARSRLQKLTKWTRKGSMVISVVKAIEEVMNNLFSSDNITMRSNDITEFYWPIFIEFDGKWEPYFFELSRQSTMKPWRVKDPTLVEAVLSLWRFSLQEKERGLTQKRQAAEVLEDQQPEIGSISKSQNGESRNEVGIRRLLGPSNTASQRDYRLWIYQGTKSNTFQSNHLEPEFPIIGFPADPSLPYSSKSRRRASGAGPRECPPPSETKSLSSGTDLQRPKSRSLISRAGSLGSGIEAVRSEAEPLRAKAESIELKGEAMISKLEPLDSKAGSIRSNVDSLGPKAESIRRQGTESEYPDPSAEYPRLEVNSLQPDDESSSQYSEDEDLSGCDSDWTESDIQSLTSEIDTLDSKVDAALYVLTTSSFERVCAQDLFSTFMWYAVGDIKSLTSNTSLARDSLRATLDEWEPPSLRNPLLETIIKAVERTELGTSEEIYMSIIPPLRSSGILENMDLGPEILINHVKEKVDLFESRQHWEEAEKAYYWLYDACLEYLQKNSTAFYQAALLLADFSATLNDPALIRGKNTKSEGRNDNRVLNLSTLALKALQKVQSGTRGEAIIQTLEMAYEKVGNHKHLPKAPKVDPATRSKDASDNQVRAALGSAYAIAAGLKGDAKEKNILGWMPIHCVIANIDVASGKSYLEDPTNLNSKDRDGRTPLHWAVLNGKESWIEALLEAGSDVDSEDRGGRTPLHLAAAADNMDILTLLVNHTRTRGFKKWTALHMAVLEASEKGVKELIEKGHDVNERDTEGKTPLHHAAEGGRYAISKLLLENRADPNATVGSGESILYSMAAGGNLEFSKLLLDNGANPKLATRYDWTALHWAVGNGHKEVARLLIERGADISARSDTGKSSLDMARNEDMRGFLGSITVSTRDSTQIGPAPISSNFIDADQPLVGQSPGLVQRRRVSTMSKRSTIESDESDVG